MPRTAYTFETAVLPEGKLELTVPIPAGVRVAVVVMTPEADEFDDLLHAASSSTDFWDNPMDDAAFQEHKIPAAQPLHATATPEEWERAFREWIASHADIAAPVIPLEALGREHIYDDR